MSTADLERQRCERDPAAAAEVLDWEVWVNDHHSEGRWTQNLEHHLRIKIYTREGAQRWGTVQLPRYGDDHRILDLTGRTVLPDGRSIPLEPRAVHEAVQAERKWAVVRALTFAFPAVEPGCIVEYRYREARAGGSAHGSTLPLQMEIPVRRVAYHVRPIAFPGWQLHESVHNADCALDQRDDEGRHLITALEQPAFRPEPLMPDDERCKATLMLAYTSANDSLLPDAPVGDYWRLVAIREARRFERACESDTAIDRIAAQVTAGADDARERVARLIAWCRREVRVISPATEDSLRLYHLPVGRDARYTLRRGLGTTADVKLLFAALARAAGLHVRIARCGSRRGPEFRNAMPLLEQLPHTAVAVELDRQWRLFTVVPEQLPWDVLPADMGGQQALLCGLDDWEFLQTSHTPAARSERIRTADLTLTPAGAMEGTLRARFTGHWNGFVREVLGEEQDTLSALRTVLELEGDWIAFGPLQVDAGAGPNAPLRVEMHVRLTQQTSAAGRDLLVEPTLWASHAPPRFTDTVRRFPVSFLFPGADRDTVQLRLPPGWRTGALPQARSISTGLLDYRLEFPVPAEPGSLRCVRTCVLAADGETDRPVERYDQVRKAFDALLENDRTTLLVGPPR